MKLLGYTIHPRVTVSLLSSLLFFPAQLAGGSCTTSSMSAIQTLSRVLIGKGSGYARLPWPSPLPLPTPLPKPKFDESHFQKECWAMLFYAKCVEILCFNNQRYFWVTLAIFGFCFILKPSYQMTYLSKEQTRKLELNLLVWQLTLYPFPPTALAFTVSSATPPSCNPH